MSFSYPVMLDVAGRPCVVIGGGMMAERRAQSLVEAGARVTVIAPTVGEWLRDAGARGEIIVIERAYRDGDLAGAFLAIAATDDAAVNARIFGEAERERVLMSAVDDNQHCHFAMPSIIRRGDLTVTVSTGGRAPALSKSVRRMLEGIIGDDYATLVAMLGRVREEEIQHRSVDQATWARRWARAMDEDLIGLVRADRVAEAEVLVRRHLQGDSRARGFVSIVGAGPGAPDLITVRGRDLVARADVIVYDRLVHASFVAGRESIYVGKAPDAHTMPQEEISALLVERARAGRRVVRLKGGDPFVFGRGAEEVDALLEAGIAFEVVPAPSSAIAAPAAAGISVTDRRVASSVAIVSGDRASDLRRVATATDTLVILMGVAELPRLARDLIDAGRDATTPVAVIEAGTLPEQRVIVGDLRTIAVLAEEAGIGSPATIVVGDVVARAGGNTLAPAQVSCAPWPAKRPARNLASISSA